ncbi:MAG: hypothetical protein WBP26_02105 [Candidatus Saccharimonadales bacterium]
MDQDPQGKFKGKPYEELASGIERSRQQRELYDRVRSSKLYPYTRWMRLHRRGIAIAAGATAVGVAAALIFWPKSGEEEPQNSDTVSSSVSGSLVPTTSLTAPNKSSEQVTPTSTALATISVTPSTLASSSESVSSIAPSSSAASSAVETGFRDPNSTISIRGSFSFGTTAYHCEDLVNSAYHQARTCTDAEQALFDNSKPQLESFANSPRVFAAFPAGYQPVDRSAMGFAACSSFEQGESADSVAANIQQWYGAAPFNTDQLARLSQQLVCPQFE